MKTKAVDVCALNALLNFPAKLWCHPFIVIHVKEPVAPRHSNTLVSLMAEMLARKAWR